VKVGDLVKMNRGYSEPGIVVKVMDITPIQPVRYIKVHWSDAGFSVEKMRDLEVINETR
jgi:hypothetical protein